MINNPLLALISRAYCTPISRQFIKLNSGAAIVVMKIRFIPTRLCHCYALIRHPSIHDLEPRLRPTPAGQRPVRAETRIQKADMMGWAAAASTHTLPAHHMINNPCGAKRKRAELWTAVSGLLALISRAYCTPISRPQDKAEQWCCNCGYENEIHTHKALPLLCTDPSSQHS